jgi:hypothetical protein
LIEVLALPHDIATTEIDAARITARLLTPAPVFSPKEQK